MDWKGCERKQTWPNLMYCPIICQEGLRKTMKIFSGARFEPGFFLIQSRNASHMTVTFSLTFFFHYRMLQELNPLLRIMFTRIFKLAYRCHVVARSCCWCRVFTSCSVRRFPVGDGGYGPDWWLQEIHALSQSVQHSSEGKVCVLCWLSKHRGALHLALPLMFKI
jgi:hypothetical protein